MSGKRKATIADVARRAGVSTATAGRVLGGYGYSSGEKRDLVMKAAEDLGYRANQLARSLITGRTQPIGIVAGDIQSPFYAKILRGVSDALRADGIGLLITNSDETIDGELEAIRLLQEKQVDGMILSPCDTHSADHLRAIAAAMPMVLIGREVEGLEVDSVGINSVAAAETHVLRLIEAGHRRSGIVAELHSGPWRDPAEFIAHVRRDPGSLGPMFPSWQRFMGYVLAHDRAGLPIDPALIARANSYQRADACREAVRLQRQPDRPAAVFAVDGLMTEGTMAAVSETGLSIPRDLSFLAFDDLDWMSFIPPGISAIAQPRRAMGEAAARLLIERIEGLQDPPRRIRLDTRYIQRGSVRSGPA